MLSWIPFSLDFWHQEGYMTMGKNLHCKQANKNDQRSQTACFFLNECWLSSSSTQIILKTAQSRHFSPFDW